MNSRWIFRMSVALVIAGVTVSIAVCCVAGAAAAAFAWRVLVVG